MSIRYCVKEEGDECNIVVADDLTYAEAIRLASEHPGRWIEESCDPYEWAHNNDDY